MTVGGLLLVDGPIPEMRVRFWTALAVSLPLGAITVFLMTIALKARANKVTTGPQGMIGEVGLAQTDLDPCGKVFVHGEIWDARARQRVSAGQRVVVKSVHDLEVEVDPVTDSAPVPALSRTTGD